MPKVLLYFSAPFFSPLFPVGGGGWSREDTIRVAFLFSLSLASFLAAQSRFMKTLLAISSNEVAFLPVNSLSFWSFLLMSG